MLTGRVSLMIDRIKSHVNIEELFLMKMKQRVGRRILARSVGVLALAILMATIAERAGSMPPQGPAPLMMDTMSLPDGKAGEPYLGEIQAEGGKLPWTFSATGLPKGLTFGNSDTIHGTPTETGAFTIVVTVADSAKPPAQVSTTFKINIAPAH